MRSNGQAFHPIAHEMITSSAGETPAGPTGSPQDESVRLADKMPVLLPADLAAFVLFFKPAHELDCPDHCGAFTSEKNFLASIAHCQAR